MIPSDQTVTVTGHTTARAVEKLSRDTARSRFPVLDPREGFVGLLHIREVARHGVWR